MTIGLDLVIDRLRMHGCGPRRCGRWWIATCPSHHDARPSLGIKETDRGTVLVRCFAGCDSRDVLAALGLSWADVLGRNEAWRRTIRLPVVSRREREAESENKEKEWELPPRPSDEALVQAARRLGGVTFDSLRSLRASVFNRGLIFPMFDASGHVIGLRYRGWDGRKWAARGSRNGLFLPERLIPFVPLAVCEGPTDTASCLSLGFRAIGLASATSGLEEAVRLVGHLRPCVVVLMTDGDEAGRRWGEDLGRRLVNTCTVRRWWPPDGCKDLRQWVMTDPTGAHGELKEAFGY